MARPLLIAIAILLSAPCLSLAATVRTVDLVGGERVVFKAARGETNHLRVSSRGDIYTFVDTRSRVEAQRGCVELDPHRVRCWPDHPGTPVVRLGDRGDRVKLTESATVRGGSGDDVLLGPDDRYGGATMYGGAGNDTLRGGRGDDRLTSGPGNDAVYGRGGEDKLRDGEPDAQAAVDRFDGGRQDHRHWDSPTGDTLSYDSRRSDLVVDLATGTWSAEDTVAGVESVIGGRGNDQLFGDAHNNRLWAGSGSDLVSGRGGQDHLSGGDGEDRLFGDDGNDNVEGGRGTDALAGGTGDDFLESATESFSVGDREHEDPGADVLGCDAGADLARSDSLDTLTAECERVSTDVVGLHSVPSIDADSADFTLTCRTAFPQPGLDGVPPALTACTGSISLSGPDGQDYGRQAFKIPVDDSWDSADAIVPVPLNAAARTALLAGTLVQVVVASKDTSSPAGGYRIFLHASPVSSR